MSLYPSTCQAKPDGPCQLDELTETAWRIYGEQAAEAGDQRDCWCDLPPHLQRRLIGEARAAQS